MRRFLAIVVLALAPAAASAQQNLTVDDILELSKANLGEEALLALIEVNRPVFPVDVATLKRLKDAGVPPRVITAIIRSGRPVPDAPALEAQELAVPAAAAPPPLPPQVVVIEHHEEPRVREVPVAVPVYVAVPVRLNHDRHPHPSGTRAVVPVYWGWGGKLRPDAWKPAIEPQKDATIQVQKK